MFRRTLIQAAAALACAAAIPSAFAFAEGTDYVALSAPLPGGEGKLVKVWSYDCPFCFKYDAGVDPKMVPAMELKRRASTAAPAPNSSPTAS